MTKSVSQPNGLIKILMITFLLLVAAKEEACNAGLGDGGQSHGAGDKGPR